MSYDIGFIFDSKDGLEFIQLLEKAEYLQTSYNAGAVNKEIVQGFPKINIKLMSEQEYRELKFEKVLNP